jgi:GNAT superfamily N-acetyltransferase
MPPTPDDHGIISERITQRLASIRFLSDFTFPSPVYRKGGMPRELADFLVIAGDTLIAFQVKSHRGRPDSEHDFHRATRKVYEAYRQFRTLLEASHDDGLTVRNDRGIEIPFELAAFNDVSLVAILHYVTDVRTAAPWHLRSVGFSDETLPITFRAFEANDFFFLSQQFDTIPDFTLFLRILDVLEEKAPHALELNFADLTAFTRLYWDEIIELLDRGTAPVHLREGIVNELLERAKEFEFAESYVVDVLLERLHTGTGSEPFFDEAALGRLRFPPRSIDAYWHAASVLALTPRLQRQQVGRLLLHKCETAISQGHSYGAVMSQSGRDAILVHSSNSSRTDRARELGGLSIAFLATHEVDSVLAIGAPAGAPLECHEVAFMSREWFGDEDLAPDPQYRELFSPTCKVDEYWKSIDSFSQL